VKVNSEQYGPMSAKVKMGCFHQNDREYETCANLHCGLRCSSFTFRFSVLKRVFNVQLLLFDSFDGSDGDVVGLGGVRVGLVNTWFKLSRVAGGNSTLVLGSRNNLLALVYPQHISRDHVPGVRRNAGNVYTDGDNEVGE
jgi:hypothetical protein